MKEFKDIRFSTDVWQPVPLITKEAREMGFAGGEGCQWLTGITFDKTDGSVAFCTVDTAAVFKSTDGGKSWSPCTVGVVGEGAASVTVDPTNNNRVVLVSTMNKNYYGGIQLSTDQGETWRHIDTAKLKVNNKHDFRIQIAFSESSYDESINGCRDIYWVTNLYQEYADEGGIYKSTDGGEHWSHIPNTQQYERSNIAVQPRTGDVYLTNSNGLYKSTDGGASFELVFEAEIKYHATTKSEPDNIYFTTGDTLYVYDTVTGTATKRNVSGYPEDYANFISVAPSDPDYMLVARDTVSPGTHLEWTQTNYYSHDGGRTWHKAESDFSGLFIPNQPRENPTSFHPADPNIVIKLGGDFIMRSEDGGANYKLASDGYNVMCIGGGFNFNVNNPNLIAVSSQDYNGGFSTDGGYTWTYLNWSGFTWGGFTYGTYMINETSIVAGLSSGWYTEREIVTTFDGGKTINHTGIKTKKPTNAIGIKGDENTVFYSDYRSTDAGRTWTQMEGCDAAFAQNADGSVIIGLFGNDTIVTSRDKGSTWQVLATVPMSEGQKIEDIAYRNTTGKVYATSNDKLHEIDLLTGDCNSTDWKGIRSISFDPDYDNIVYASVKNLANYSDDSAYRSIDGGKTWTCINTSPIDGRKGPDGGRATNFVRVDSKGCPWYVGHCRGLWKMPRPDLSQM